MNSIHVHVCEKYSAKHTRITRLVLHMNFALQYLKFPVDDLEINKETHPDRAYYLFRFRF